MGTITSINRSFKANDIAMSNRKYIVGLLILLCLSGCNFFSKRSVQSRLVQPVLGQEVAMTVIREDLWSTGGKLVFIPFIPGSRAEAGQLVDRLSLMILKGAIEAFSDKSGVFQLMTEEDVNLAELILDGRIEEFSLAGKWSGVGLGRKESTLTVKGEIRERRTGAVVAIIFASRSFKKLKDSDQVAYALGRAIAEKVQH